MSDDPSPFKIISQRSCVVHDADTGDVLHIHHVTTYEGGEDPSDDSVHATALEHYKTIASKDARQNVGTLIVDPADIPRSTPKIDTKAKKLIAG